MVTKTNIKSFSFNVSNFKPIISKFFQRLEIQEMFVSLLINPFFRETTVGSNNSCYYF